MIEEQDSCPLAFMFTSRLTAMHVKYSLQRTVLSTLFLYESKKLLIPVCLVKEPVL
jgi:hypothetical protein